MHARSAGAWEVTEPSLSVLYGNMEARYRGWWLHCSRKAVRQQRKRYSLDALGRCRGSPPRSTSGTIHGLSLSPEVLQLDSAVIIRHDAWVLQVFSHMASNAPAPILVKATLRRQGLATTRPHRRCIGAVRPVRCSAESPGAVPQRHGRGVCLKTLARRFAGRFLIPESWLQNVHRAHGTGGFLL